MNDKQSILVLVKTYPEISKKYTETVCIAGIHKTTKKLIRLYPVRYRYLDAESRFKKYQWIKAKIEKANTDPRPESFNPIESTLEVGSIIDSKDDWVEREKWVINENTLFKSVEDLKISQQQKGTSLGIVKPKRILDFTITSKPLDKLEKAETTKRIVHSERGLFEQPKEIDLLPINMMLKFECDDSSCITHNMSILDWEFGQLYRKIKGSVGWEQKIKDKIKMICDNSRDTYLILGNIVRWQHTFCILGMFYPPKGRQMSLF